MKNFGNIYIYIDIYMQYIEQKLKSTKKSLRFCFSFNFYTF